MANAAANARLEGQELPEEDEELAAAYLAGEIDAATYQPRIRDPRDRLRLNRLTGGTPRVEGVKGVYRICNQSGMKAASWSITMLMMAAFTSSPFSWRDSATLTRSRMIPSNASGGIGIGWSELPGPASGVTARLNRRLPGPRRPLA